jgi:hypothetical protein
VRGPSRSTGEFSLTRQSVRGEAQWTTIASSTCIMLDSLSMKDYASTRISATEQRKCIVVGPLSYLIHVA